MDEGIATDPPLNALHATSSPPKRPPKRKRDHATTRDGLSDTEPASFFMDLIRMLQAREECHQFRAPVLELWEDSAVPGYRQKIKIPMDLRTVSERLNNGHYAVDPSTTPSASPADKLFMFDERAATADIRRIFTNAMEYNEPGSEIHETSSNVLALVDEKIHSRSTKQARQAERAKRDAERRRRKAAEEEAATAAAKAARTAAALARAKQEAEEAERRRVAEMKQREAQWLKRLEAEKEQAVQLALKQAMVRQAIPIAPQPALAAAATTNTAAAATTSTPVVSTPIAHTVNVPQTPPKAVTSSVSSEDGGDAVPELTFAFVSTAGMEKKRGRKSAQVVDLEVQHDALMRRRKVLMDLMVELHNAKQVDMSLEEKQRLCEEVSQLDFVRMKAVVDIIAKGMNQHDIMTEAEIELDVDSIDNVVLREIQFFLKSPTLTTAKVALQGIEEEITGIETKLVDIRFQKVG